MACGDTRDADKVMTYSKSNVPLIGALIDYVDSSVQYLMTRSFTQAKILHEKSSKSALSAGFLAFVCLLLGFVCNVKLEVVRIDERPLEHDMHYMLLSQEEKLYIDDIDVSRILWCIEASDMLVLLISCLLIWNTSHVSSPLSEYLFLPWLGMSLRGMFLRQVPTVAALIYTMAVVNGNVDVLFLTGISFLFLMEARMWLEIARVVRSRWEMRDQNHDANNTYEVETLWSNDDVQSVEVQNYVY